MPTIDEELIQNGKAVFHSKVEHTEDVTFGKNAEFDGKVQVNSAKDLVTKDGTSFGGGGDDIFELEFNRFVGDETPTATLTDDEITKLKKCNFLRLVDEGTVYGVLSHYSDTEFMLSFVNNNNPACTSFGCHLEEYNKTLTLNLAAPDVALNSELPDLYATKSDITALQNSINNLNIHKQSTLYRHTVLISEPTNKTAYLAFTAESEKNTPIDSIQDLIAVFGNTSIACSGLYRDSDPSNEQSLLMINAGTSISNTTIASATLENSAITSFSNALFTDVFGTTGFTITDSVTAM